MNFSASIGVSLSNGGKVLSHFGEASLAILTIDKGDECRHDPTPLLINASSLHGNDFRLSSPHVKNGFFACLDGFFDDSRRSQLTGP
jgi:hypothetical protein